MPEGKIISYMDSNNVNVQVERPDGSPQQATLVKLPGNQDVLINDQYSDPVIGKFNAIISATLTSSDTVIGGKTIVLADATGFNSGNYIILYSPNDLRFFVANIVSVLANTITVDSPIDFVFPSGSVIKSTETNMAVDGSDIPVVYGLRGVSEQYPFDVKFDITRLIFSGQTDNACDLSTFGDIAGGILNGLLFRKRKSGYKNIFNVKTNMEMANIMFDFQILSSTNPVQGQDGFIGRITFNGQDKIGVALRIESGEDIEFLVQDDISSITLLEVVAEGHVVED